jgi:hypothetical protein
MENRFIGMDRRMLKDISLRLYGEISNLRMDSKQFRHRLETTRSELAAKNYELDQVKDALQRLAVIPFPKKEKAPDIAARGSQVQKRRSS